MRAAVSVVILLTGGQLTPNLFPNRRDGSARAPESSPFEHRGPQVPGLPRIEQVLSAASQPGRPEEPRSAEPHEGEAEEGLFPSIARLINAGILFGTLGYFLRKPIAEYLTTRQTQVRQDLVTAADMRKDAAEQLEALDRKMRALPGEIETLKKQGAQEIAQEEARISEAAAAERQRLLEQSRREIELQLRIAQRELIEHAANLTIGVATERIKQNITDQDQARLVDRYVEQLKK